MLDWLTPQSQKTDHPMYCIEEAERLLTGLSGEPLKALEEIASWLTTLTQAAGFQLATRLAVMQVVDEAGQPFEPELTRLYLTQRALTEFERQQLWQTTLHFWVCLEGAYRLCLNEMQRDPRLLRAHAADLPLLCVRMMRALASQVQLLNLRYMPVRESLRQALFDIYQVSEKAGCGDQRVTAYPGDAMPTTPREELLRAALLDIARPDSMLPQQTDITARVAARYANACLFDQKPRAGCNWMIDLALPRPPEPATGASGLHLTARFFGAGAVTIKIREVTRRLAAGHLVKEQRFGEEYTSQEKLAVLERLARYWGEQPPYRHEKRRPADGAIGTILGFANACRQIPRVLYRDWGQLVIGLDPKLRERLGIIADPAAIPVSEKWQQRDASAWGLSAAVTRESEPAVRIGMLCSLKMDDKPWWIGVVRRLFRDDEEHGLTGIEVLAKKPATVLLRRVGHGGMSVQDFSKASDASGNDYINVLLLGASMAERKQHELLTARGEFIAGIVYEAMIGEGKQHFRFEELLEQGEDFDRVRFTRISGKTKDTAPA